MTRRYDLKTALVALLCLTAASAGGLLLYRDYASVGARGRGSPMATVEKAESKVRKKASDSYAWQNVSEREELFKRESVQTGGASGAVLRFKDGSVLELSENSLVVIDDIANLSLNFLKGSMVLRDSTGADKQISVGQDGKQKVEALSIRLIKPDTLAEFFVEPGASKPMAFEWQVPGQNDGALATTLEISPDRAFKNRVQSVPVTGKLSAEKPLAPGRYFWRVAAAGGGKSPIRQFRVTEAQALNPVAPSGNEVLRVFGNETSVAFQWSGVTPDTSSGKHLLELSRTADFQSVILSQSIAASGGASSIARIPAGPLYWRIQSRYGEIAVASPSAKFTLEQTQNVALQLALPGDGDSVPLKPQLRFSWNCDAPGVAFTWEIRDTNGASVAKSSGTVPSSLWKVLGPGQYRWQVSASWNGKSIAETPWRALAVTAGQPLTLVAPARNASYSFWTGAPALTFQWQPDPLIEQPDYQYQVEIDRDAAFRAPIVKRQTRVPSLTLADFGTTVSGKPAAPYQWRVRVIDRAGQPVKTSEPLSFTYGIKPLLPPSSPVQASSRFDLRELKKKDERGEIRWTPVEGATAYQVSLTREASERAPAQAPTRIQQVVNGTSLGIMKLPAGRYHWTVRAIDPLKRAGEPSVPATADITLGKLLAAPKIVSPEVQ